MRLLLTAAIVALLTGEALAQTPQDWPACEVTGGSFTGNPGNASTARMRVRQGNTCAVIQRGFRYSAAENPRNGSLVIDGSRATYRPNPGFSGTDIFVLRMGNASAGTMSPWFMTVNVEVR